MARRARLERVRFLAPFDPVVWDRRRFELFWGWAYRFEAYTPVRKRKLGYYALPLLWRDEVLGWANLTWARAQGADFTEASLAWVRAYGADLSGATFRSANLTRAQLVGARLRGADLRRARLQGTSFEQADLLGADFSGADPSQALFGAAEHVPAHIGANVKR